MDIKIFEYDTVGSTNTEAKEYARRALTDESALFVARAQSDGRGRMGRSFLSRDGRGIYMSLLYFAKGALCDAISITTAAALYTAEAIENVTGNRMRIKWVNDIYNDRGKVAGILTEAVTLGESTAVIVGIGINTGEDSFPEELRGIASSIGEISERERQDIISNIVSSLLDHAKAPESREYMKGYRERFMLDGAYVDLISAGERIASGHVKGVSDDGGLIFLPDGESEERMISTGEVSVRKIKG